MIKNILISAFSLLLVTAYAEEIKDKHVQEYVKVGDAEITKALAVLELISEAVTKKVTAKSESKK